MKTVTSGMIYLQKQSFSSASFLVIINNHCDILLDNIILTVQNGRQLYLYLQLRFNSKCLITAFPNRLFVKVPWVCLQMITLKRSDNLWYKLILYKISMQWQITFLLRFDAFTQSIKTSHPIVILMQFMIIQFICT